MNAGRNENITRREPQPQNDPEARIVAAARELFLKDGFNATTTDTLCKAASVSKTTLYKYFGDMTGVLEAVVVAEGAQFRINRLEFATTRAAFWNDLIAFGARLMQLLNEDFCIQLDRMLHEEARSVPQLADRFFESTYAATHREVAAFIADGQIKGFVKTQGDPEDLSDYLVSMWEGRPYASARLGRTKHPFPNPAERARRCVETLFALDWIDAMEN